MTTRAEARARTTAKILEAARRQIATEGGGALSMRAVAREVGMVSSAVFRYYATKEALLTALILESYGHLAAALEQAPRARRADRRWEQLTHVLRDWARRNPHEFQLLYGTPVPGYVAPPETIPAAAAVALPFLQVGGRSPVEGFEDEVAGQLQDLADQAGVDPAGAAAVLAELATLVGAISLELSGHLVGTADPADHLYRAIVLRQIGTLGLEEE